jgi:hypothetical protein
MEKKKPKQSKEESEKDKKAYKDLIKRLQDKGLVLIKGVWQKPNKK